MFSSFRDRHLLIMSGSALLLLYLINRRRTSKLLSVSVANNPAEISEASFTDLRPSLTIVTMISCRLFATRFCDLSRSGS